MTAQELQELLEAYPFLLIPQQAEDLLRQVESSFDLLQLYAFYFQEDFYDLQAQGISLLPEEETYSEFEMRFFELVDAHLFPVYLDWIQDDVYESRAFAYHIPLAPFGLDFENGYDETPLGWMLLLYLLNLVNEQAVRGVAEEIDEHLFSLEIPSQGFVSPSLLQLRCEAQAGPLAYLPDALRMLNYDTGTVWLDTTLSNIQLSDFCWSEEDMNQLHAEFLEASEVQERAEAFCAWLEEAPMPRFRQVACLWRTCVRDTPPPDRGLKTLVISASQFREGINFGELFGRHIALPAHRGEEGGEA